MRQKVHQFQLKSCRYETRCVCETQIPPIMANSKDGQGHKDKYLDTSRNILSQEMRMCSMKALIFIIKKWWNHGKVLSQGNSCEISKL